MARNSLKPVLLSLLVLISVSSSGRSHDYYPLNDGNYWVLEEVGADQPRTRLIKVNSVPDHPGRYRLTRRTGEQTDEFLLEENPKGILVLESHVNTFFGVADFVYDPPQIFFPSNLTPGTSWSILGEASIAGLKINTVTNATVEEIETLQVKAGVFRDCARIRQEYFINTLKVSTTLMWLAPEAGIVREKGSSDEFVLVEFLLTGKDVAVSSRDSMSVVWARLKS